MWQPPKKPNQEQSEQTEKVEGLSLGALANLHLGSNPPLFGNNTTSSSSLASLANAHLGNSNQGIKVPPLGDLNQGPSLLCLAKKHTGESTLTFPSLNQTKNPEQEIDLLSALRTNTSLPLPTKKALKPREDTKPSVHKKKVVEILVEKNHWGNLKVKHCKSQPSCLGKVLCRKWRRRPIIKPVNRHQDKIQPFKFDSQSPDDIVRAAQSTVFARHHKYSINK